MTWNGDEWSVFPPISWVNRVGSESAPRFGHSAPLRQRPRGLAGNDGQRWATAQWHKPWGARPRLAIGDGGELHADGEVARDLRRKSYQNPVENPIGIAKYNF